MCIRVMSSGEHAFTADGQHEASKLSNSNLKHDADLQPLVVGARKIEICHSIAHFNQYGIGLPVLENATTAAGLSGRLPAEELIMSGAITRSSYALISAGHLGIAYSNNGPDPSLLTGKINQHNIRSDDIYSTDYSNIATEYCGWQQRPNIFIAYEPTAHDFTRNLIANKEIKRGQIFLTTRKALDFCQFVANQKHHLKIAVDGLALRYASLSAKRVITGPQISTILLAILAIIIVSTYSSLWVLFGLHVLASSFYLAVTLMRGSMIIPGSNLVLDQPPHIRHTNDRELPFYTVMVALYDEAGQVDALVASLNRINWPRDRLQVLLICEEGDVDTITKCQVYDNQEIFQTIICPVAYPKTKPKALNFALPLARGDFLVLYDAEDRPHSDQLREAHMKFGQADDLACLQAPLVIHNDNQSWFTRMFAIEYTTQFSLILPVLEKWNSPIPLGGTSNHFRTSVLRKIGGWDPYNVTEDADLGIRLARFGYRCGTIKHPTFEEAPPVFSVWFKQRTRWIKGWLQTLLVHMRNPAKLARDLGFIKTCYFHLVISAIVLSVLIHPFFIVSSIYYAVMIVQQPHLNTVAAWMLGIDAFNLVGGYSTYFAIAWLALNAKGKWHLRSSILWLPFYWLLISLAGWRAVIQLFTNPHVWEKTQHGLSEATPMNDS